MDPSRSCSIPRILWDGRASTTCERHSMQSTKAKMTPSGSPSKRVHSRWSNFSWLFLNERTRLDINCQDNKSGGTYLLAAARGGDIQLVNLILGFGGVDLNARNQQGESALEVSCHQKHHHVFQRLVGWGAVYCRGSWFVCEYMVDRTNEIFF